MRFKTIKEINDYLELLSKTDFPYKLEDFTCFDYKSWIECPYAFDIYSTNSDCLAIK